MSDDLELLAQRAREGVRARADAVRNARTELKLAAEVEAGPLYNPTGSRQDVSRALLSGPLKAVRNAHELLGKMVDPAADWLGEHFGDLGDLGDGFGYNTPAEIRAYNGKEKMKTLITGTEPVDPVTGLMDKGVAALGTPETTAGALTEGVTQFLTGLLPVSRGAKALNILQGAGRATTVVRGLLTSAASSGIAFDNTEANLANLIEASKAEGGIPDLSNAVTEFLATDANESEVSGRLKNMLTDAVGGVAVEGFIAGLRGLKSWRAAKAAGETEVKPEVDTAGAPKPDLDVTSEPQFTLTDEPLTPTPVKVDEAAARARDARAAKLSLEGEPAPAVAQAEAHVEKLEAKAEALETAVKESQPAPVKEMNADETYSKLRADLGITDEKLDAIRKQVLDGTVKPEKVADLLGINPDRLGWSSVSDPEDMVGMLNAMTRLLGDATAQKAGYARVSVETVAKMADQVGGNGDDAIKLWESLQAGEGVEARLLSARTFAAASAARLQRLAKRITAGTHDPQDLIELIVHDRRNALLQTVVRGAKSMVARALRICREGVEVNEAALKLSNGRRLRDARKAREQIVTVKDRATHAKEAAKAAETAKAAEAKAAADQDAHVTAKKEWESAVEAARTALDKAHANRMASELRKTKEATKEAATASRAEAREATAIHDRLAKEAQKFEDHNAKLNPTGAGVDVNLTGDVKMSMDEVEHALKGMGLRTDDVTRLAEALAKIEDMTALNAASRKAGTSIVSRVSSLYINNILSGVPTMVVNVTSGFYKMIESAVENYGHAALATIRGGDRFDRILATKSTVATFTSWRSAWKLAGKAWKEGVPQTDVMAKAEVSIRGGAEITGNGKVDAVLTSPSRLIVTIDEFFKHIFYQQELTARSVEVAASAARLQPTKAAQDRMFKQVLEDTLMNPPDDLALDAIEAARYNTFQGNLESKALNNLVKMTNDTPVLKLIVPFVKTPSNIIKQGYLERTPLALLRQRTWQAMREGSREGNVAATRIILGTTAMATVWQLADNGVINGSREGNGANKNTADLSGAAPYSAKIGNAWYQYNRFDPLGTVLGLTADLRLYMNDRRARGENETTIDDPDAIEWAGSILSILQTNLTDKTFFKGISDFLEAFDSAGTSTQGAENYVTTLLTNLVPFSSMQRNIARAHDGYAREAWTFVDKLKQQTPGLSESLPLNRDVLGRPIKQTDRVGADWMSPFVISKDDPDLAAKALAALGMGYRMPDKDIAGVSLDATQYSRLKEVRGAHIAGQLNEWLASGEWDELTKYQKTEKVRDWMHTATQVAKRTVLEENPELEALVDNRKGEIAALKSGEQRERFITDLFE